MPRNKWSVPRQALVKLSSSSLQAVWAKACTALLLEGESTSRDGLVAYAFPEGDCLREVGRKE